MDPRANLIRTTPAAIVLAALLLAFVSACEGSDDGEDAGQAGASGGDAAGAGGGPRLPTRTPIVIEAHSDDVRALAFSPDGTTLATGSTDQTVALWDAATGAPRGTPFTDHEASVTALAWSPDGTTIASADYDGTTLLWDPETGAQVAAPMEHTDSVLDVELSPDGTVLLTANNDGVVRVWDASTGEPIGEPLVGHSDPDSPSQVNGISFAPDGSLFATSSYDGTIQRWDGTTRQPMGDLLGPIEDIRDVVFGPDSTTLFASGLHGPTVWNVETGEQILQIAGGTTGGGGPPSALALSADGSLIAMGDNESAVHLRDAVTGDDLGDWEGHEESIRALAFDPAGRAMASGARGGSVRIWPF